MKHVRLKPSLLIKKRTRNLQRSWRNESIIDKYKEDLHKTETKLNDKELNSINTRINEIQTVLNKNPFLGREHRPLFKRKLSLKPDR
jgi:hypothetical protein